MARNPWNGSVSKAAALSVARRIFKRDRLSWARSLRKALAWARRKGLEPADRYAAARAQGVFSPLDRSAEAEAEFKRRAGHAGGSLWWGGR